jgi:hypothetical protein
MVVGAQRTLLERQRFASAVGRVLRGHGEAGGAVLELEVAGGVRVGQEASQDVGHQRSSRRPLVSFGEMKRSGRECRNADDRAQESQGLPLTGPAFGLELDARIDFEALDPG